MGLSVWFLEKTYTIFTNSSRYLFKLTFNQHPKKVCQTEIMQQRHHHYAFAQTRLTINLLDQKEKKIVMKNVLLILLQVWKWKTSLNLHIYIYITKTIILVRPQGFKFVCYVRQSNWFRLSSVAYSKEDTWAKGDVISKDIYMR